MDAKWAEPRRTSSCTADSLPGSIPGCGFSTVLLRWGLLTPGGVGCLCMYS